MKRQEPARPGAALFSSVTAEKQIPVSRDHATGWAGGGLSGTDASGWRHSSDLALAALEGNVAFLKGLARRVG